MTSLSANSSPKKIWLAVADWLVERTKELPPVWPPELPEEHVPEFWFTACRFEMMTRKEVSARLRIMIHGGDLGVVRPLEAWFFRRRMEWAAQLALAAAQRRVVPENEFLALLERVLIHSWETDGCIAMWNAAERGGKPHPENPDGLSPLGPNG